MKKFPFIFLLLSSCFFYGCFLWTTRNDGEIIKQKIQHLDDRMEQLNKENEEAMERLQEMIDTARDELLILEETLSKATRVLARNSADFGADMETLRDEMRMNQGSQAELSHELNRVLQQVAEIRRQLREFALAAGLDLPVDEDKVSKQPAQHFDMMKKSFAEGRYGEVRSLGNLFLSRHPRHKLADDAQLLIAKSYIAQKRWAKALGSLRRFTDRYPKSRLTQASIAVIKTI